MKTKLALITAITAVMALSAYSCGKVESTEKKVDIDISRSDSSTRESETEPASETTSAKSQDSDRSSAKDNLRSKGIGIEFKGEMKDDTTGKLRLALTATKVDVIEYAVDYYKAYFESDDEIHAIVNKNSGTTTCISKSGDTLSVKVHKYVEGEEEDTLKLFSGTVMKEETIGLDGSLISSNETAVQQTSAQTTQPATSASTGSAGNNNNNNNNNNNKNTAPETPVQQTTEAPTEAPTEEVTEAPTEEVTEAPTEIPTEPPTEAPAPTEQPNWTFSLNDLNTNPADMFNIIGQGQADTAPGCLANGADSVVHSYDGLRIECYSLNGSETVYGITITDSRWEILGNVKVGSTRAEIESVYSEGEEENGKYVCKMGNSVLTFSFAGDAVSSIDFYMPVN